MLPLAAGYLDTCTRRYTFKESRTSRQGFLVHVILRQRRDAGYPLYIHITGRGLHHGEAKEQALPCVL